MERMERGLTPAVPGWFHFDPYPNEGTLKRQGLTRANIWQGEVRFAKKKKKKKQKTGKPIPKAQGKAFDPLSFTGRRWISRMQLKSPIHSMDPGIITRDPTICFHGPKGTPKVPGPFSLSPPENGLRTGWGWWLINQYSNQV